MTLKREARVIGIDDGPFDKFKNTTALVIGTFYRGGEFLDGILSTRVRIDGKDSTRKITNMIKGCKWKSQIQAIMLDGIAVGGFNVIDIVELNKVTDTPIIVIMRVLPDLDKIINTLLKLDMKEKVELIRKAGQIHKFNKIHYQVCGAIQSKAEDLIRLTIKNAEIPEPLRVAHIIASGVVKGESYGL